MKKRDWKLFVQDMLNSLSRIESYIKQIDYDAFNDDQMMIDAVIRNLEIIGEACKYIPEKIRNKYYDVPWKAIIGLRNIAIHEYFGLDIDNIWKIIKDELPPTRHILENIFEDEQ